MSAANQPSILVVDDDPAVVRGVCGLLRDKGYRTLEATSASQARQALESDRELPSLMLLDIRMPGETGLQLLERLPKPPPIPVVVLSGEASAQEAITALKLGATDFVEKPPTPERLLTAIQNALALAELREDQERLRQELAKPGNLIGESAAAKELRRVIAQVGPSSATVLITGETGAGKERVARALHLASGRKGRFVAVNCAAIPAQLLESELFGYERGAFSGAAARHLGRVEQAQAGTLLLDEVAELPLELQAKMLRVLEQREIERLGGKGSVPIDVRFLAATNQDLTAAAQAGRIRQDLFYRLSVFPIQVAPLRERPDDVLPLLKAFAAEFLGPARAVRIAPAAEAMLRSRSWPGNVRELRNFVERCALIAGPGPLVIDQHQLRELLPARPAAASAPVLGEKSYRELLDDYERSLLGEALRQSGGNVAAAARLLKVDRGNLYRRLKALGLALDAQP
ncbi:MAG TPA: sigma-54 dependent transcriptional regulator [Myxococcaceae bacterium]|nr:sigma-54 dependent transcriptional regulator [Myxococcaceae bacterium]